ncbi:MAG: UDP-N-acetylmuramoyl-tripeptide--D-alanyl-D-alanine ligase, partial [Microgenomates bacterium 39_7]
SSAKLQYQPFVPSTNNTTIESQIDKKGKLSLYIDQHLVQSQLVGEHYSSIVLGAAVVAKHLKVSSKKIATAISTFEPDESFVKFFRHKQGFWVIDDGRTSNPIGFAAALDLTKQLLEKRQFSGNCVLFTSGIIDLGEASSSTHLRLAQTAAKTFSQVVYLGESGKKEFAETFKDNLIDSDEKVKIMLPLLTVNDLILVEGRLPIWLAKSLEIKQS